MSAADTSQSDRVQQPPVRLERLSPGADRVVALSVLALAALFVGFLLPLTPDPAGHGTHEQLAALGFGRCSWPELYGKPCPTCGVTTAAVLLLHLRPFAALQTQPFGAVLALLGLAMAVAAARRVLGGRPFVTTLSRWVTARTLLALAVLFFAAWGYKVLTW
jgi:hypothetical protein